MKITKYEVLGKLPDLFTFDTGERVRSIADWRERRAEIYKTAVEMQYGQMPPQPEFLDITPLTTPGAGRMNIWKLTTGTRQKPVSFTMYAHFPTSKGPWPVVIDGDLCYGCTQDPATGRLFSSDGILFVAFNRCELVPDQRNPSRVGNLYDTYSDLQFGALAAWAWGYSRVLDALIALNLVDLSSVTFTGLSRGGKTALLAGAVDERATIVCPEATCAGGSSCYRIHMSALREDGVEARSETLKDIINAFPDWFGPEMKAYEDNEAGLPFDAHSLKALVAPRVFFDCQALSDIWAGPVNTWQTSIAAKEVWKLYGKEENVLWYWRSGGHAQTIEDFDMLRQVINWQRRGDTLCEKFNRIPFEPLEPIYDWSCPDVVE